MTDDEQAFWDRAFCAALTGMCGNIDAELVGELANGIRGGRPLVGAAVVLADAALAARQRKEST